MKNILKKVILWMVVVSLCIPQFYSNKILAEEYSEDLVSQEENLTTSSDITQEEEADILPNITTPASINIQYETLCDAEKYVMAHYFEMSEKDYEAIIWPEIELYELEAKKDSLHLYSDIIDDHDKEIIKYGYVWSYDYEEPTVTENQGMVEYDNIEGVKSFEHIIDSQGTVYVRSFVVYDQYVGYSNQRQLILTESESKMFGSSAFMMALGEDLLFARSEVGGPTNGTTFFKDTGDDLDKLRIAIGGVDSLCVNIDVTDLPSDSAHLVLRGAFGGLSYVFINGKYLALIGTSVNKEYYAIELNKNDLKLGTNKIEIYIGVLAWAKIDALNVVLDDGDDTLGKLTDMNFEDYTIQYKSQNDTYYTDIYANTQVENIDPSKNLKLISSLGLKGSNHFSNSEYVYLNDMNSREQYIVTLPDDRDYEDATSASKRDFDETGSWKLFSMIVDGKKVTNVVSRGFYYTDSVGPRNFNLKFSQSEDQYTNSAVDIIAEVEDLFNKPFSHIICPDGQEIYDYSASYQVIESDSYTFKIVEPDGTITEFIHQVSNIDKIAPTITLNGGSTVMIIEEEPYVDMGIFLNDDLSGFSSTNPVIDYDGMDPNNPTPGTYVLTYTIWDKAGNTASTNRTVVVKNKPLSVATGNITKTSTEVTLSGNILYLGEEEIVEKGLIWGLTANPTVDNNSGKVTLTENISNKNLFNKVIALEDLYANTSYHVRAYVKTIDGQVVYGQDKAFESNNKNYGNFQLSVSQVEVTKGSDINLNIVRTDGSDGEVTVYYRTLSGSALGGLQFTEKDGSVTFADGDDSSKTITIKTMDYTTFEKSNREFYVEVYDIQGKGNIGVLNRANIKFTNDIDIIENIQNDTWVTKWSYTGINSEDNGTFYFPNTTGVNLEQYKYWQQNANSFLGRGYGIVNTNAADVRFALEQYISSWSESSYSVFATTDGGVYTNVNGKDISDVNMLRLKVEVFNAGGAFDDGGVMSPKIQLKISDSTKPIIESFYVTDGNYSSGDQIYIGAKFSEIVNCTDTTNLSLMINLHTDGGSDITQEAHYIAGNQTDVFVFALTVPDNTYNNQLEMTASKLNNSETIKDLVGNVLDVSALSSTIDVNVKIASINHRIAFSQNGSTTPSTSHSTVVTVENNPEIPAIITECQYLWSKEMSIQDSGFESFNSGDLLTVSGVTGAYYLHIKSKDSYGNETYILSNVFIVNNEEPYFDIVPSTTAWTNSDVILSIVNMPPDANIIKRFYRSGYFSVSDFDITSAISFAGDSFPVSQNNMYSIYLETETGKKYVNYINIENIDKILPSITIGTDGSEETTVYLGKSSIDAYDEGDSELNTLEYMWSSSVEEPTSGWMSMVSGDFVEIDSTGIWYLHIRAVDHAGNETYVKSRRFIIDHSSPTLTLTASMPTSWTKSSVNVVVDAQKDNLEYVILPDLTTVQAVVSGSQKIVNTNFTIDKNGYYTFVAVDSSGNTIEKSLNMTKIDTDAPNILVERSAETWTKDPVTLTVSINDLASVVYDNEGEFLEYNGIEGITVKKFNSGIYEPYTEPFNYTITDNGTYQISAKDALGNISIRNIAVNNIDNTPPYVESDNTDYSTKNSPISVNLKYEDLEMGIVKDKLFKVSNSAVTPTEYDSYDGSTITLIEDAQWYIHYKATDGAGNVTTGYYGPYIIANDAPSITIMAEDAETYKKSHDAKIIVDYNGMAEGNITYQWTHDSETPGTGWQDVVENNGIISRSSSFADNGDLYLHVRVLAGSTYYYGKRMFRFDNNPPTITLLGDQVYLLPFGDDYVEAGIIYEDNYDLWPSYIEPDVSSINNECLGSYPITYVVEDKAGNKIEVIRTVQVVDITPPTVKNIMSTIDEDQILTFDKEIFNNQFIDEASNLGSVKIRTLPSIGQLYLEGEVISIDQVIAESELGKITYEPNQNIFGVDGFTYSAFDRYNNESNEAQVIINITSINDAPVATNDIGNVDEDHSLVINIRENDLDIETPRENLSIHSISEPAHGVVINHNDGTITYQPDANWNGVDTFTYTLEDSSGGTNTGSVVITVNPVNDEPSLPTHFAVDDIAPYYGGQKIRMSWSGASDIDMDSLSYEISYYNSVSWTIIGADITTEYIEFIIPLVNINNGRFRIRTYDGEVFSTGYLESSTFVVDSTLPHAVPSILLKEWTNANYNIELTYLDDVGIEEIYYEVTHDTSTPDVFDDLIKENISDSENVTTIKENILIHEEGVNYIHYKIVDVAGNTLTGYTGPYKLDKTAPVATNDIGYVDEDHSLVINIRENDSDILTPRENLSIHSISEPAHGVVINHNDGTITYQPDANWNGVDTFTYTLEDSSGGTNTGSVVITVNPVNDEPSLPTHFAVDDIAPYYGGQKVRMSWSGASDIDMDSLSYEISYYNSTSWTTISAGITTEYMEFVLPVVNINNGRFRIRTYDGEVFSTGYLESSTFVVDSTLPHAVPSILLKEWTNANYNIELTYLDDVGIEEIYYEVTHDTSTPDVFDDLIKENISDSENVTTIKENILIHEEGVNFIHYKIVDVAGNTVTGYTGPYQLDKTAPDQFDIQVLGKSESEISIQGITIDNLTNSSDVSGIKFYDYSINSIYNNMYEADGKYSFTGLEANKDYALKMKGIDEAGNIVETDSITVYTKASDPIGSTCDAYSENEMTITLLPSGANVLEPEFMVWLTLKDDANVVSTTEYNKSLSRSFEGLKEETEYDVWVQTRNEKLEDNLPMKIAVYKTNHANKKKAEVSNPLLIVDSAVSHLGVENLAVNFMDNSVTDNEAVYIELKTSSPEMILEIKKICEIKEYDMILEPLFVDIFYEIDGKKEALIKFKEYISQAIELSKNILKESITTAIQINEEGKIFHVPTRIINENGQQIVEINSLMNSDYILIHHDVAYEDIKEHWASEDIYDFGARTITDIMVEKDKFEPNKNISRGEFIAVLANALGIRSDNVNRTFVDVDTSNQYYQFIEGAFEYGLIFGYEDGTYHPNDTISREEAMTIINRGIELVGLSVEEINKIDDGEIMIHYADLDMVSEWAKESISNCISTHIVKGKDKDMLAPKDNVSRAEAVVFIRRLLMKAELI